MMGRHKYFYNIKAMDEDWARTIVFLGEAAKFVKASNDEVLLAGGFMGMDYNYKIG